MNFIIPWHLYPFDVMVSFKETDKQLFKKIEKIYCLDDEEKELLKIKGNGRTVILAGGPTVIRLNNKDFPIIAHESFHAVSFLMQKIGVKDEEAYAYAIQYLTEEITNKL